MYNYMESSITLAIARAYYHEDERIVKTLEPFQCSININKIIKSSVYRLGSYKNVSTLCMKISSVQPIKNLASKIFIEDVHLKSLELIE